MAKTFETLDVWKKSMDLGLDIYKITKNFPKEEIYGLTAQIRRAVMSVSNNIAEGSGLDSNRQFIKHLKISKGSLN
jgi:four helix bundle protein